MDDLKIFAKNRTEIDSLVSTVKVISHDTGMEFGVKKCGVAIMKRKKLVENEETDLGNGESIKDIDLEGYRYLGTIEADRIREKEMKEIFLKEYLRHTRLIMRSKLGGRNKIMTLNTWVVSLMRYGEGILGWYTNELQKLDRKIRKIMKINIELHPRNDIARIYVSRRKGEEAI